jgi:hypothetical protein
MTPKELKHQAQLVCEIRYVHDDEYDIQAVGATTHICFGCSATNHILPECPNVKLMQKAIAAHLIAQKALLRYLQPPSASKAIHQVSVDTDKQPPASVDGDLLRLDDIAPLDPSSMDSPMDFP